MRRRGNKINTGNVTSLLQALGSPWPTLRELLSEEAGLIRCSWLSLAFFSCTQQQTTSEEIHPFLSFSSRVGTFAEESEGCRTNSIRLCTDPLCGTVQSLLSATVLPLPKMPVLRHAGGLEIFQINIKFSHSSRFSADRGPKSGPQAGA